MKNFLKTSDFSRAELEEIIESALKFKKGEIADKGLSGKSVALVFFNPSLRTRASMQIGIYELGGNAVILEPGNTSWTLEHRENVVMDSDKTEHLKEFVGVLERYVSAIGVRTFAELKDWQAERIEPILSAFERYSTKPIINLESAMHHPCQALADMLTIRERFGKHRKKVLLTWAWHPKPLPMAVPNSFALAAAQFGHDLRIAHPKGYELDDELIAEVVKQAAEAGAVWKSFTMSNRLLTTLKSFMPKVGAVNNFTARRKKTLNFAPICEKIGLWTKPKCGARTTRFLCTVFRFGEMSSSPTR